MEKIFIDENKEYQIDFSKSNWISKDLNTIFHTANTPMSDADVVFEHIVELKEQNLNLVFVEYKNGNVLGAKVVFNPFEQKKIDTIIRKYYDSLIYMMATKPKSNYSYVYILEYPNGDSTLRKMLRAKIQARLPFRLQESTDVKIKLIDNFEILSIDEWNNHVEYSKYPITKLVNNKSE